MLTVLFAPGRTLLGSFLLSTSLTLAACAAPTAEPADAEPGAQEEELRGDTAYVRAVAAAATEAAGAATRGGDFVSHVEDVLPALAATPYAASLRRVDAWKLSRGWQSRIDGETAKHRTSEPERGFRTPMLLETYEVLRDGRVVGVVANMGIVESWRPPHWESPEYEGDPPEPSSGRWLWFGPSRRVLTETSW